MSRRRLQLIGIPAVTLAGLFAFWLLWPRSVITAENAQKIQKGMTLAKVEAVFGGAARNESSGRPMWVTVGGTGNPDIFGNHHIFDQQPRQWESDAVMVLVWFDAEGCVESARIWPKRPADHGGFFDMILRWLSL